MKKIYLVFIIVMLTLCAVFAYAADKQVSGTHLENGIRCVDCHETDEPTKRANQRACQSCHGDMSDKTEPMHFKDAAGAMHEIAIHKSHAGQIRCTLCHMSHQPAVLYCNEGCHHTFEIKVP